jgi:hypothetical protein
MVENQDPREDFPVDTFRFMEVELGKLRRKIMKKAAEIARAECSQRAIKYIVTIEHVKQSFKEIIG